MPTRLTLNGFGTTCRPGTGRCRRAGGRGRGKFGSSPPPVPSRRLRRLAITGGRRSRPPPPRSIANQSLTRSVQTCVAAIIFAIAASAAPRRPPAMPWPVTYPCWGVPAFAATAADAALPHTSGRQNVNTSIVSPTYLCHNVLRTLWLNRLPTPGLPPTMSSIFLRPWIRHAADVFSASRSLLSLVPLIRLVQSWCSRQG